MELKVLGKLWHLALASWLVTNVVTRWIFIWANKLSFSPYVCKRNRLFPFTPKVSNRGSWTGKETVLVSGALDPFIAFTLELID
jgi:hypothetical protein